MKTPKKLRPAAKAKASPRPPAGAVIAPEPGITFLAPPGHGDGSFWLGTPLGDERYHITLAHLHGDDTVTVYGRRIAANQTGPFGMRLRFDLPAPKK